MHLLCRVRTSWIFPSGEKHIAPMKISRRVNVARKQMGEHKINRTVDDVSDIPMYNIVQMKVFKTTRKVHNKDQDIIPVVRCSFQDFLKVLDCGTFVCVFHNKKVCVRYLP